MEDIKHIDLSTDEMLEPEKSSGLNISKIVFATLKRPWIPILTVLLITSAALFHYLNSIRLYRSQSEVMVSVRENSFGMMNFLGDGSEQAKPGHYYNSILNSKNYLNAVLDRILPYRPEYEFATLDKELNFSVDSREPGLFTLYSMTPEENMAQVIVEIAVDEFRKRIASLDQQEAKAVLEFINEQLDGLNQKIVKAEEELQNFLRDNQFILEDPELGVAQELTKLENQLTEAETNQRLVDLDIESTQQQIKILLDTGQSELDIAANSKKSRIESEQEKNHDKIEQARKDKLPLAYIDSLETINRALSAELLEIITDSYLDEEDNQTVSIGNLRSILEELSVEKKRINNRVKFFKVALESFREQHPNISKDILQHTQLQRQRDVLTQTLAIMLEKKEETRIRMASQIGGLKVIEDPTEAAPQAKNTVRKTIFVFLLSGIFGIGLAVLVDMMRNTIDSESDIMKYFGVSLLGVIPSLDSGRSGKRKKTKNNKDTKNVSHLISDFSPRSWFTEAMLSIKTSLLFRAKERNAMVFGITSAMPSEGKTLTTANLATIIQRGGRRTLIIDVDLRKPKQHRLFGVSRKPGLTDYLLSDDLPIESVIQPTSEKYLHFLSAGRTTHNPAELVASKKMRDLLNSLRSKYDYILVDTPPVLPAVDSRLIGSIVDNLILVARAEQTKVRSFQSAVDLLRDLDIEIIGVILNNADRRYNRLYYYSYGRYNSYYHYYYRPYTYYGKAENEKDDQQDD